MKQIVLLGSAHPLRGGLAAFNERLANEYLKLGHQVIIYTFSLQYPSFLFPGKTQYSDQPAPKDLIIRVKVNSINPINWIFIGNEINKLNADILLIKFWLPFMAPCFGTIARMVKKNKKTKVICILDNVLPHEKRLGDKQLINYFIKACDGFISMSKQVMNDLSLFYKGKNVKLIPHPVYDLFGETINKTEACKALQLDSSVNYILFFGFIRKYKGLDLLLEALGNAQLKDKNIKAIIAGEFYEEKKDYLEIIDRLQLQNQIILKDDFIPDSQVKYYFSACDVVVQPYRSATQSGISQIAYHFEKPMIVTNVGGLPELVHHHKTGFVVNTDPSEIAHAILQFYSDDYATKFAPHLKEEKKKFSWDVMARGTIELVS